MEAGHCFVDSRDMVEELTLPVFEATRVATRRRFGVALRCVALRLKRPSIDVAEFGGWSVVMSALLLETG